MIDALRGNGRVKLIHVRQDSNASLTIPFAESLDLRQTVVKHEAFAVRKSSGRLVPAEDPLGQAQDTGAWTHERAERYERLRIGAEAMAGLKPHEIRCLLLKAEGLSYQEICEATGFTYTKVNRSLFSIRAGQSTGPPTVATPSIMTPCVGSASACAQTPLVARISTRRTPSSTRSQHPSSAAFKTALMAVPALGFL